MSYFTCVPFPLPPIGAHSKVFVKTTTPFPSVTVYVPCRMSCIQGVSVALELVVEEAVEDAVVATEHQGQTQAEVVLPVDVTTPEYVTVTPYSFVVVQVALEITTLPGDVFEAVH